jgi:hypothetical protein
MREIPLMKEFLGAYRNPRVRLFRRNIINKNMQDLHTGKVHKVNAGIKGQADCYAFVRASKPVVGTAGLIVGWTLTQGTAINIEIEFKGARTPTSDEQKQWRAFCQEWGIPHIVLRAAHDEEPLQTMARWTRELNAIVATFG